MDTWDSSIELMMWYMQLNDTHLLTSTKNNTMSYVLLPGTVVHPLTLANLLAAPMTPSKILTKQVSLHPDRLMPTSGLSVCFHSFNRDIDGYYGFYYPSDIFIFTS